MNALGYVMVQARRDNDSDRWQQLSKMINGVAQIDEDQRATLVKLMDSKPKPSSLLELLPIASWVNTCHA